MAVSCTIFEIKRDIGRKKAYFSYPLVFNFHDPLEELLIQTVQVSGLLGGAKILPKKVQVCGRLSWLPVSFLLHVKYPLSYRKSLPRVQQR